MEPPSRCVRGVLLAGRDIQGRLGGQIESQRRKWLCVNSLVDLVKGRGRFSLRHFEKPVSICAFLTFTTQCGEHGFEVDGSVRSHSWPGSVGGDDRETSEGDKCRRYLGGDGIRFGYRLIRWGKGRSLE